MGWAHASVRALAGRRWVVLDAVCAAVLTAVAVPAAAHGHGAGAGGTVGAVGLAVAQALPVAWRRRAPALVLVVTALSALGLAGVGRAGLPAGLTPALALYCLAAAAGQRVAVVGLGFAAVATGVALVVEDRSVTYLTATGMALAAAWAIGTNVRTRRAYLAELQDRARRLAADRDRDARQAATTERQRIARELHDVVTHNVTVMVISAGAARIMADADPDRLRAELAAVERVGRQTLTELRHLLGVLRADDTGAGLREPQPGLARLDALLARIREAGLPVELVIEGQPRLLPQGIDVSAFRIVQEALSNTLRHAGPCSARVEVCYGDADLQLAILDDGRGPAPGDADGRDGHGRGGHGVIGMRERAAMVGGHLHTGPASGGGFTVRASLPVDGTP
jgi:signal transduction histidine kinase